MERRALGQALFGWLAFAVAAMVVGNVVGHVQMKDSQAAIGRDGDGAAHARAGRVQAAGDRERPDPEPPSTTQATRGSVARSPAVVQTLALQQNVTNIQNPLFTQGGGGQISRDGHSVLVQFTIRATRTRPKDKVEPILEAVAGVQAGNPSISVREVGNASANYELEQAVRQGLRERRAADDPDHAAHPAGRVRRARRGRAAGAARVLGRARLARRSTRSSRTSTSGDYQSTSSVVILLIGMAVGVDYSLFYLRREREERAAGSGAARRRCFAPRRPPGRRC